jgi:hypothetical protein
MNKKKQKIMSILLCMLVIATVLPVTSAINMSLVKENSKSTNIETSIDPNIHLTRAKLPLLQKALRQIDNPNVKQFVQEIISILSVRNIITSKDLHSIVDKLNLHLQVHTGILLSSGVGDVNCFPGFQMSQIFYIGPVCVGSWSGGFTRAGFFGWCNDDQQQGWFIGFVGFVKNRWVDAPGYPIDVHTIVGLSCLTIIDNSN